MAVPSFHGVVFFTLHIFRVESFEPLQGLKVAFKIPFYELFHWNGLNRDREDILNKDTECKKINIYPSFYPSIEKNTPKLEYGRHLKSVIQSRLPCDRFGFFSVNNVCACV